jgi:hypothetical protein
MTNMPAFIQEPEDIYHAKAKDYLSSHRLADFRACPFLFYKKEQGLIPDVDRPAYIVGRAAHKLIIEGQTIFDSSYTVGGPVNPKTGKVYGSNTKAFTEWAEAQGKPIITDAQFALITNLHNAVHSHTVAKELLSDGIAEGVIRETYCSVPCQIRIDWFSPEQGIVDLKTCDDLTWFEADARRYGYIYQIAFYRAVVAEAIGETVPVFIIAVEKKEPFRCGVWRVGEDVLGAAQQENEAAIHRLIKCRESNLWPTGYENVREFDYL